MSESIRCGYRFPVPNLGMGKRFLCQDQTLVGFSCVIHRKDFLASQYHV